MRIFPITLDIQKPTSIPYISFNSADSMANSLDIEVLDNGLDYDLSGCTAQFFVKRADKVQLENSIQSIAGNKITIVFDAESQAVPGSCTAELHIKKGASRIAICQFKYYVSQSISGMVSQTTDMIPLWQQVYNRLDYAIAEVDAQTDIKKQELLDYNNSILAPISTQESARVTEEDKRKASETNRANAESSRVTEEGKRALEELKRATAEGNRNSAEVYRETSEITRDTNETTRNNNESIRISQENARKTAENSRGTAETARASAETNRANAETTRNNNETTRNTKESQRQTAETARSNAETTRNDNETIRQSQEATRQSNEVARQTAYAEITDAREGYFGDAHPNLKTRMDEEYENLHLRIAQAEAVEYSTDKPFLTVDYGIAAKSDVLLEGNTLVNLAPLNMFPNDYRVNGYISARSLKDIEVGKDYTFIAKFKTIGTNVNGQVCRLLYEEGGQVETLIDNTSLENFQGVVINKVRLNKPLKTTGANLQIGWLRSSNPIENNLIVEYLLILEGDYTNKPLPSCFEGLKSVGQTTNKIEICSVGENLFDYTKVQLGGGMTQDKDVFTKPANISSSVFLTRKLKPNTTYVIGAEQLIGSGQGSFRFVARDENSIDLIALGSLSRPFTTGKSGIVTIIIDSSSSALPYLLSYKLWLNEGSTAKPYSPYVSNKTDILLSSPLRSLPNGTKDTAEVKDGKLVVTRNTKEFVLNGTESGWQYVATYGNVKRFDLAISDLQSFNTGGDILSDKYKKVIISTLDVEGINIHATIQQVQIQKSTTDLTTFKAELQANPVTIVYKLATPIKEEFVLEPIQNYNGITNFFIESGAVPISKFTARVPSKVSQVLAALQAANKVLTDQNSQLMEQQTYQNDFILEVDFRAAMAGIGVTLP